MPFFFFSEKDRRRISHLVKKEWLKAWNGGVKYIDYGWGEGKIVGRDSQRVAKLLLGTEDDIYRFSIYNKSGDKDLLVTWE